MGSDERQKRLALGGAFDLPLDVHLHTLLSPDSSVPVDVYPALAIALGMPRIAITDHLDFDPREPGTTMTSHERRVEVIEELAAGSATRSRSCSASRSPTSGPTNSTSATT